MKWLDVFIRQVTSTMAIQTSEASKNLMEAMMANIIANAKQDLPCKRCEERWSVHVDGKCPFAPTIFLMPAVCEAVSFILYKKWDVIEPDTDMDTFSVTLVRDGR